MLYQAYNLRVNATQAVAGTEVIDYDCSAEFCTSCTVPAPALVVTARGLCSSSAFDKTFTYHVDNTGDPYYLGDASTEIRYDKERGAWVWKLLEDKSRSASSKKVEQRFLHLGNFIIKYER